MQIFQQLVDCLRLIDIGSKCNNLYLLCLLWLWYVPVVLADIDVRDWPKTDFSRSSVNLEQFVPAGSAKDGIASIDEPVFETPQQAQKWLHPREPVIVYH